MESVRIIKNLKGEFVSAEVVKEASQKEYNQSIWNNTVDRYSKFNEVKFFKTPGTIYEFDYYAIYVVNGIRFLKEVSYNSCLSSGGFNYGFYTEGCKDKESVAKLVAVYPEYKDIDKDTLTILGYTNGSISTGEVAREFMRIESKAVATRFFTKEF